MGSCPRVWKHKLPLSKLGCGYEGRLKPGELFLSHSHQNSSVNHPGWFPPAGKTEPQASGLLSTPHGNTLSSLWGGLFRTKPGEGWNVGNNDVSPCGSYTHFFTENISKIQAIMRIYRYFIIYKIVLFIKFINPHVTIIPILQMREMEVLWGQPKFTMLVCPLCPSFLAQGPCPTWTHLPILSTHLVPELPLDLYILSTHLFLFDLLKAL